MALTQAQKTLVERAQAAGGGILGAGLSDEACAFLVFVIAYDLGIEGILTTAIPQVGFFDERNPEKMVLSDVEFYPLIERLFQTLPDTDTYFACLAALQKSRLKYARILQHQPIPTMEQVGPRALLQYGQMSPEALAGFLFWRKWLFDIDNRAGQETGYLFEPIIAHAIGGVPFSASKSPVRRHTEPTKGRQVDCIRQKHAYEIKIRVTIAASGQGRWREELDFPIDCRESGYVPVLIVLDSTPNAKLDELVSAFEAAGGKTYIGSAAWEHLEDAAGDTMSLFIEKYVRIPISRVLESSPEELPDIAFKMDGDKFSVIVGAETNEFPREL
ncbi:MAG: hypothetical protein R2911_32815 [Caldilineaceae bacterium]